MEQSRRYGSSGLGVDEYTDGHPRCNDTAMLLENKEARLIGGESDAYDDGNIEPSSKFSRIWKYVAATYVAGAMLAMVGIVTTQGGTKTPTAVMTQLFGNEASDPFLEGQIGKCKVNCGGDPHIEPQVVSSKDGKLAVDLHVTTARYQGPISFNVRAYDGGVPGKTMVVKPGDKLEITLYNDMDFPTQVMSTWDGVNEQIAYATGTCEPYQSPNLTSLHLHGLHVDPLIDNPFQTASPHEVLSYKFIIPANHPSGTFWYHPHEAKSHSIQVAGGMGGALIVEDIVTEDTSPEFQWLLSRMQEKLLLVSWISYSDSFGNYDFLSICGHNGMPVQAVDYFGMSEFSVINGVYNPTIEIESGVYYRFRVVNAMAHRFLGADFSEMVACSKWIIASDGAYTLQPRKMKADYLFTSLGARTDVVLYCTSEAEGSYDIITGAPTTIMSTTKIKALYGTDPGWHDGSLMTIVVKPISSKGGGDEYKDLTSYLDQKLPHGYYGMDLSDTALEDLKYYFPIMSENSNIVTMWYEMNGYEYDGRMHHRIRLNEVQEWKIAHHPTTWIGAEKSHNWHIHTFHFQIVQATDDDGNVYTESPLGDWVAGDWRDVVNIPRAGSLTVRFMPTKYVGLIHHHCHIYNHETGGLKEIIAVLDCSESMYAQIYEVCHGQQDWPWAGFNCEHLCTDESMEMLTR